MIIWTNKKNYSLNEQCSQPTKKRKYGKRKNCYKKTIEKRQEYTFHEELNVYLSDKTYNTFYKYVIDNDSQSGHISRKYNTKKKQIEDLTCSDLQALKQENLLYIIPPILEMNEPGDEKDNIRKRNLKEQDVPEEDINDYFHEIFDL